MDRAERRRRVGDELITSRENERVLGRRHPAREIVIDEPQDQRGQHVVVRGEDTMPLDGEVTPREGRTSRELARDVVSEAAGGEQRRLNAQHLDLVRLARARVEEDRRPVGPRLVAGLGRGDRHVRPGNSCRKEAQLLEFGRIVAGAIFGHREPAGPRSIGNASSVRIPAV